MMAINQNDMMSFDINRNPPINSKLRKLNLEKADPTKYSSPKSTNREDALRESVKKGMLKMNTQGEAIL